MGISGARFVMGLKDSSGDVDFSPNSYGTFVALSGVVGVTPTTPASPIPLPAPTSQQAIGSVPHSVRTKRKSAWRCPLLPTQVPGSAGLAVRSQPARSLVRGWF